MKAAQFSILLLLYTLNVFGQKQRHRIYYRRFQCYLLVKKIFSEYKVGNTGSKCQRSMDLHALLMPASPSMAAGNWTLWTLHRA